MAGGELDYGYRPPDVYRQNDPWDHLQGWDTRNDKHITGPHGSDIEYGWGVTGIVNTDEDTKAFEAQQNGGAGGQGGGEVTQEMMIRYYVPPKVAHPKSRQHKDVPQATQLVKKNTLADQATEKTAMQELIENPRWHVVRAGEQWRVLRPKGAEGPEPEPHDVEPRTTGVLVVVEPKRTSSAQRYIKELRRKGFNQTCIALVEKSPSCRDPVAVSTMSTALLANGANEVLMDGWLSYYVNGMALGGYKASLTSKGMVSNPVAGDVAYQGGYGGGTNFYGPSGMVAIG